MSTTGVLVIAHGSKNKTWIQRIDQAISRISIGSPIRIGFLEMVEDRSISDAVRELEKENVQQIIAIPLFISNGSTHLEEIKYALGLIEKCSVETNIDLIKPQVNVVWSPAMDTHPYILDILIERLQSLSEDPAQENLLLIAHGSDVHGFQSLWIDMLERLSSSLQERFGLNNTQYATLLPDSISQKAKLLSAHKKLIVLPIFLSEGYFTTKVIPQKLAGLSYVYSGETYLPHPLVSRWIEEQILQVWR
jgi:sirohydrochlorin cobaltochelatase